MTDTDRELLEWAAKAAGYEVEESTVGGESHLYLKGDLLRWTPLTNDGDALRLAVRLNLWPQRGIWSDGEYVVIELPSGYVEAQPFGDDPLAATRLVIVRAAATIGKAMP